MKTLNRQQQTTVTSGGLKTLVIAGPGSGKTATLAERIKQDIKDGVDPKGICVVTFTNAAAAELGERIRGEQLGYIGTLHSLCLRLVREHYKLAGYAEAPVVADPTLCEEMLTEASESLSYRGTKKDLKAAIGMGPVTILSGDGMIGSPAHRVARAYYLTLRGNGMIDFDSLLHFTVEILASEKVPMPFASLYVDEYQDSSDLDARIYPSLAPRWFMVGDPDQAIYGWRGGNVKNILSMESRKDVATHLLDLNYRSDVSIALAANSLIEKNPGRVSKSIRPVSVSLGAVSARKTDSEMTEVYELCQGIRSRVSDGADPSSIAVLTRTNAIAAMIADCLAKTGVPVAMKASAVNRPKDWALCSRWVGLFSTPDNMQLGYFIARELRGVDFANTLRMDALKQCKSMNDLLFNLKRGIDPEEVPALLSQCKISQQSIAIVEQMIKDLPIGATIGDLALTIASGDANRPEIGKGVVVTTMHCGKGREWDVVYLPGWNESFFPLPGADIEEERRLAFVAITRARHEVQISFSAWRTPPWPKAKPQERPASQFVTECGCVVSRG
jgi:DNA helicase II / ATP-dependent DNA helicase PcrA